MAKVVESIRRAMAVMDLLGEAPNGLHLTDIAERMELPKGSVYRVLASLASQDYVKKDPETSRYFLGTKILRLQRTIATRSDLVPAAIPHLNNLSRELHETVHLAVLDEGQIMYLESRRPERSYSYAPSLGRVAPVYCTALGKSQARKVCVPHPEMEPRHP